MLIPPFAEGFLMLHIRLLTLLAAGCSVLTVSAFLAAAEKPADGAKKPAEETIDILAGHSAHGEAFNEGARQKAYLMGGTGNITFPVTTSSSLVQRFINQGVGQLHGFWYFEAERSFRQAAALDPNCAIAYWGMAMANKNNAKRSQGFMKKAMERKSHTSDHEQMYLVALNDYINAKGSQRGKRGRALAAAFGRIAKKYPNDLEAKAFQGLFYYLTRSSKPTLKYEDVDKLLREVLAVNPLHPCHHYRIHLWDYKDAKRALNSAALCGQSAPAIAHMWHMPGHIYSRLKRYQDAVWQQEASARVDHAHMIRDQVLPDQIHNFAHNNEWLIRNLIYVGRAHDAIDLAKNMTELPRHPKYNTLSRRGSTTYGRMRLFQVLSEYELWDDLIALSQTPYLEPTSKSSEQANRLRHLGRAYFGKGNIKKGSEILAQVALRLKSEQQAKAAALSKAAADFRRKKGAAIALKPGQKPVRSRIADRQLKTTLRNAGRSFDTKIRVLQGAVNEFQGRKAIAAGKFKVGLALLKKASGISQMDIARIQLKSDDKAGAEKTLTNYVKSHNNEVLPLANLVTVLWNAGKQDEAKKQFALLRTVGGQADLDVPALSRLTPIAAELQWPKDWRTPPQHPADFGNRPNLDDLGPFRWHPFRAVDWSLKDFNGKVHSLKDYRGRPVVVIFYLGYGCLHCAEQLEAFAPKTDAFRKAGYELIAISSDNMQELKKSHDNYKKGKFPFPLVSDAKLDIFKKYRCFDDFEGFELHGTFVIDGNGNVRWQDVSYEPFMDPDFVLKEANRLLGQTAVSTAARKRTPSATASASAR